MTDTLAYQIAAAFFLAVLFMAGTKTRGLFPGVFQNVKLTMLVAGGLLVAWVAYQELPDLSGAFDWAGNRDGLVRSSTASSKPDAERDDRSKPAKRAAPAVRIRPAESAAVAMPAPKTVTLAQEPVEPPEHIQVAGPVAAVESEPVAPVRENGSRVGKAIKSVGHFLHIGHEKYQQPVVAPVPASVQ